MTKSVKRFTLRLPLELYFKIKNEADKKGIAVNALIISIIEEDYYWKELFLCRKTKTFLKKGVDIWLHKC